MSLYRRKGTQFWWSKLYAGGRVHRFSTGARTKVEALGKEREEARRLARLHATAEVRSVATVAALFLENVEAGNLSEAWRKKQEAYLTDYIIPFLGAHREASTITTRDLEDFKARRMRAVSPITVAKELTTLRQMLEFAGTILKLFPPGETPTVKSPKLPRYQPKWTLLTAAGLARLITELAKQTRKGREAFPYFVLMMNTGMRGGEQSAVRWEWIDFQAKEIHLPATATKTRRARAVPLNPWALAAIEAMRTGETQIGRVFAYKAHYGAWHKAVHAAGLAKPGTEPSKTSGVRPHDLRHTYGSMLHADGASMPKVRDILGHVTLMMANLYAHTHRAELHQAVNAVQVPVPAAVPLVRLSRVNFGQFVSESNGRRKAASPTGN